VTIPEYFLLLAAVCFAIRGFYGIVQVIDECRQRAVLDEFWADQDEGAVPRGESGALVFPIEWTRPYDQERSMNVDS
jgi:hypothetical protein